MNFRLEVRCEGGHVQELRMEGVPSELWIAAYCGLIDGTGEMYFSKPCDDPRSIIGKCGLCGKQVKATYELLP